MSTARLIKLSPTVILLGYLSYGIFTLQPPQVDAAQTERAIEKTVMDLLAEGAEVAGELTGRIRDPFWAHELAPDSPAQPAKPIAAEPAVDPVAESVRGMSLDATFLQGRDQLAVINGRIYSRGQTMTVDVGGDGPPRELKLLFVTRTGVILRSDGKNYSLGYPTELGKKPEHEDGPGKGADPALAQIEGAGENAMIEKLLNSPLGAMGRSLIGQVGKSAIPARGPKPGSRGNRGVVPPPSR